MAICRKESHLRRLGLFETEVVVVTPLDYSCVGERTASDTSEVVIFARKSTRTHREVDSVPKGVGAGETDTDAVVSGNAVLAAVLRVGCIWNGTKDERGGKVSDEPLSELRRVSVKAASA